jgi:hypothetical protein
MAEQLAVCAEDTDAVSGVDSRLELEAGLFMLLTV